ncbi:biotin-protein ligase [Sporodiniella umbellata]|nr:biotin-protein ligase [Sporodiniella umbellata]
MNVLIYNGAGTSLNSVKHTYSTLKILLGHAYDVMKVDALTLKNEPWEETCSLLVIPGGRDAPYCEDLDHTKIQRYVQQGGSYLGFCAGGYYASREIAFEVGTPLAIQGPRPLGFFPGLCRGTVFPGFVYNSEKGARSVTIGYGQRTLQTYYNGGGAFSQAAPEQVFCVYQDTQEPAGVLCQVQKGRALLFGVHPEYDIREIDLFENEDADRLKKELTASLPDCRQLLSDGLVQLGLKVSSSDIPALTPMYLSAVKQDIVDNIQNRFLKEADGQRVLKDVHDSFCLQSQDPSCLNIISDQPAPSNYFNVQKYYQFLLDRRSQEWGGGAWYHIGNAMLYSQVITSTQTVLDKNYNFTQILPNGLVCLATNQIAGRGRGKNAWVSQAGALQFSFIVRHGLHPKAPVVFIQYLIANAIVESIRTRPGYEQVPLRLKWPNDIYAETKDGLKKVGGLLVNSSFMQNEFLLVIGCGVNLNNPQPTVSINDVIQTHNPALPRLEPEQVLAHALVHFEKFYSQFCEEGMGSWFLNKYYERWLHTDKVVTLTTHENEQAKIVGITSDYGMLEAVSVNNPRKRFTLQPDGNSFDMLKGLIVQKQ